MQEDTERISKVRTEKMSAKARKRGDRDSGNEVQSKAVSYEIKVMKDTLKISPIIYMKSLFDGERRRQRKEHSHDQRLIMALAFGTKEEWGRCLP